MMYFFCLVLFLYEKNQKSRAAEKKAKLSFITLRRKSYSQALIKTQPIINHHLNFSW